MMDTNAHSCYSDYGLCYQSVSLEVVKLFAPYVSSLRMNNFLETEYESTDLVTHLTRLKLPRIRKVIIDGRWGFTVDQMIKLSEKLPITPL